MEKTSRGETQSGFTLLTISISLAVFMSSLDGTIVNIALPTISTDFNLSSSTVSWVATIYLLVLAGCVLIFGKLADRIGFKKIFLTGFIIFTLGSFSCAILPDLLNSFAVLVGSRVFQAIGGAMITAIAPAMVTAFIPMSQKGKAMGVIMTAAALGTAIGPTIGGVLTQYLSWHWIFFINVPVGIIAVLLGAKVIPATGPLSKPAGFDKAGALLIFVGLAALLFAVSEGMSLGWTSPVILSSLALAIITLGYFVLHELRVADPLLELRLFKNKNFLMTNLIMALVFFSFAGINYLLPFYLQYVKGYGVSDSGLILTALSAAMMVAGVISGLLYNRVGGRKLCIAAGILLVIGYFMMTLLRINTSTGFVTITLLVLGFSLGLMITPASNMIMNSVGKQYQGMVSSLTSLERFAPLTLGIAFANLVFMQGIAAIAGHRGITESAPAKIQMELMTAGFDLAFFASLVIAVIILILAILARQEVHPDYQAGNDDDAKIGII
ncbi:DHA2 family efflux MFS transporter permease subunit [uncultured Methanoregula sp.]|uniref:DHA2 family efflux MFS transporter permease subunit n=1 Tax=uncultured Methanoregula sp. TaxID=1005933 RepID=UPI002AAB64C1|nr:DHA2 family efflux MFS transporter permease subunit [uncultured Methanoregula sp.]